MICVNRWIAPLPPSSWTKGRRCAGDLLQPGAGGRGPGPLGERLLCGGTPAEEAGRLQGGIVLDAWKKDPAALDKNGDGVLQYVMLEGEPGHRGCAAADGLQRQDADDRRRDHGEAGQLQRRLAAGAGHRAGCSSGWRSSGDRIELVFANNDDMALGAIDACLAAGMTQEEMPFIVGVDATPPRAGGTGRGHAPGDGPQ